MGGEPRPYCSLMPLGVSGLVTRIYPQLTQVAELAFVDSLNWTIGRAAANGVAPQEPDFVAGFVIAGTHRLQTGWRPLFQRHRIRIRIAGVFTHQSPKVEFSQIAGRTCELADLLFAHFHVGPTGMFQSAVLWQAKMNPGGASHSLGANDQDQLTLYTLWPKFTYTSPGTLAGKTRHVTPPKPHPGGQYLLIDPNPRPPIQDRVTTAMPASLLNPVRFAGTEIIEMLRLNGGRSFSSSPFGSTDWSEVVWDLLRASWSHAWTFQRGNMDPHRIPRGWWGRQLSGLAVGDTEFVGSGQGPVQGEIRHFDEIPEQERTPPIDPSWPEGGGPPSVVYILTQQVGE